MRVDSCCIMWSCGIFILFLLLFMAFGLWFFSDVSFILSDHEGGDGKILGEMSRVITRPKMLGGMCMDVYEKSKLDRKQYLILCPS